MKQSSVYLAYLLDPILSLYIIFCSSILDFRTTLALQRLGGGGGGARGKILFHNFLTANAYDLKLCDFSPNLYGNILAQKRFFLTGGWAPVNKILNFFAIFQNKKMLMSAVLLWKAMVLSVFLLQLFNTYLFTTEISKNIARNVHKEHNSIFRLFSKILHRDSRKCWHKQNNVLYCQIFFSSDAEYIEVLSCQVSYEIDKY